MLLMFKVKNYMSFKGESILDMRATSYIQHPTHVISLDEKTQLLKTNALYGANASGKSNFISAMFFFEQYIFSQFLGKSEKNEDIDFDELQQPKIKLEPFLLSDDENRASEFDIIFVHRGKTIQYGFECTAKEVVSEWYFIDERKIFERNNGTISYGTKYKSMLSDYNKIPKERLYLSVLDYFLNDDARKDVLNDFISFFTNEYNVFFEIMFEATVKRVAGTTMLSKKLIENKAFRERVEHYLRLIDVGIQRLEIQTETITNENTGKAQKRKVALTVHNVYGVDGKIIGEKLFRLQQESTGTTRFLAYIQNVVEMIDNGGVFIVDELSARLHPLLTKLLVDLFQSAKSQKAQLIFTTHDISLLNNNQFRRDEVSFIDKNEKGESTLYALSDLRIREDATFSKDYLQGKYGAIPIFDYDALLGGDI